jgi:hypothetical protein
MIDLHAHWLTEAEVDKLGKPDFYVPPDPITHYESGWYWWDETWTGIKGPWIDRHDALDDLERYCKEKL